MLLKGDEEIEVIQGYSRSKKPGALISLPTAGFLLVTIFTVHLPYGFSSIKLIAVTHAGAQLEPPGYECHLLYLACLTAPVLGGSGPPAIDGLIRRRRIVESTRQ